MAQSAAVGTARLVILGPEGGQLADYSTRITGPVDTPRWTGDSQQVLLRASTKEATRIVALDTANGAVVELTPPYFRNVSAAVSPDGTRLLATNGYGAFWMLPQLPIDEGARGRARASRPPSRSLA
ncbi:MAG: hypothetical protein M1401_01750 [Chloroflexi bacterium]|nr:hypothetical protein [Chloroflexota bacterium]